MKIKNIALVLAAMGLVTTASADTEIWLAGDGNQVATSGYWFAFDDQANNGTSTWSCGGVTGAEGDAINGKDEMGKPSSAPDCLSTDNLVMDFNVTAEAGTTDKYGFAAVGFNFENVVAGSKVPYDATGTTGIAVTYKSTCAIKLQADLGPALVGDGSHETKLPKQAALTEVIKPWSSFAQPTWWKTAGKIWDLETKLNVLEAMKFQIHSENVDGACSVEISKVYLTGNIIPVFGGATGVNFEYNLVGESLVFSNLTSTVEVFDLQGKMVANGEVSSSANSISLEGLKNASYVVRTSEGQFLISIAK